MRRKILTVFILFVASYYGLHNYLKWQRYRHRRSAISLFNCNIDQVNALNFQRAKDGKIEEFDFQKKVPEVSGQIPASYQNTLAVWTVSGAIEGEADKTKVTRILSALCESKQAEPLDGADEAKKIMQMDPIKLTLPSATKPFIATVGGVDNQRGLMVDVVSGNIPGIYRVPIVLKQSLTASASDFLNHKVARLDPDDLQEADLVRGKDTIHLERTSAGWLVSQKKSKKTSKGEADRFVNRLMNLQAIEVRDSKFSSDLCGAVLFFASVTVKAVDGREEKFQFWRQPDSGDNFFGCSSQRNAKFLVHKEMEKYLLLKFNELAK